MENKGYEFQKDGHTHYFDGKKMTGITTVLSVIAKPALISWAVNEAIKSVNEEWKPDVSYSEEAIKIILDKAKIAHRNKKEEAGQKGTDVHDIIEKLIKLAIKNDNGFIEPVINEEKQIQHFINWAVKNKVRFLGSENNIFSEKLWLGGICDFVCEIDDEVWIGDIKTGSGIYPEHFFQMAGYQILFQEMGLHPNIKGHLILNLKKDGTFAEKRSVSNEDNKNAFLSALNLYGMIEKINGQIINK